MNWFLLIAFLDGLGGVTILLQHVPYRAACSIYNLCMCNVLYKRPPTGEKVLIEAIFVQYLEIIVNDVVPIQRR